MNEKAYNVKRFWDNFRKAVVDFERVIGDVLNY